MLKQSTKIFLLLIALGVIIFASGATYFFSHEMESLTTHLKSGM